MRNQLLLLEDVANVGRKGDLVVVKPGFSRNYLVPQQKAIVADRSVVKIQARLKEERAKQAIEDKKASEELRDSLEHKVITTEVNVDPEGHMYGSVSAKNIVELLAKEGITIERRMVSIEHSIKTLGTHSITIKLKEGVVAPFTLKVQPDEAGMLIAKKAKEKAEKQAKLEKEACPRTSFRRRDA